MPETERLCAKEDSLVHQFEQCSCLDLPLTSTKVRKKEIDKRLVEIGTKLSDILYFKTRAFFDGYLHYYFFLRNLNRKLDG